MKVFVVYGSQGIYSDTCVWAVKSFASRDAAEKCAAALTACAEYWRSEINEKDAWDWDTQVRITKLGRSQLALLGQKTSPKYDGDSDPDGESPRLSSGYEVKYEVVELEHEA